MLTFNIFLYKYILEFTKTMSPEQPCTLHFSFKDHISISCLKCIHLEFVQYLHIYIVYVDKEFIRTRVYHYLSKGNFDQGRIRRSLCWWPSPEAWRFTVTELPDTTGNYRGLGWNGKHVAPSTCRWITTRRS